MNAIIVPERLAQLDQITLDEGSHGSFEKGHCAMEVVAWLANQGHTDAPQCASPVLARYTIRLNDRWDSERRQTLKPYLPRMVGTSDDGKDARREEIASEWLTTRLLGPWLDLAGMGDHMASIEGKTGYELRSALRAIRDVAYDNQLASRIELRAKVKARLIEQGRPVADAVAVAAAGAAADAAAVADAVAAAGAAAAADADAAADAAVGAVAAAAVGAVAAAAADAQSWGTSYSAAYAAARDYYKKNPLPIMGAIADLAAKQQPMALELLDAMIEAKS